MPDQVVLSRLRHALRAELSGAFPQCHAVAHGYAANNSEVWTLGGLKRTVSAVSVAVLRFWLAVGFIGAIGGLSAPATPAWASPGPGGLSVHPANFTCNSKCTRSVEVTITNHGTAAIRADEPTIQVTTGEAQGKIIGSARRELIQPDFNEQWQINLTVSQLPAAIIISVAYKDVRTNVSSDSHADIYFAPITPITPITRITPVTSSNTPWPEEWGGEIGAGVALLAVLLGYFVARRADFISWRRDTKHKTYSSLLAWIQDFRNTAHNDFSSGLIAATAKAPQIRALVDEKRAELDLLSASQSVIDQFEAARRQMTELDNVLKSHVEDLANIAPGVDTDSRWTTYDGEFTKVVKEFLNATRKDLTKDGQRSLWRRLRGIVSGRPRQELPPAA